MFWSLLWLVFLCHPVGYADVEPLKLRKSGCHEIPGLAAI